MNIERLIQVSELYKYHKYLAYAELAKMMKDNVASNKLFSAALYHYSYDYGIATIEAYDDDIVQNCYNDNDMGKYTYVYDYYSLLRLPLDKDLSVCIPMPLLNIWSNKGVYPCIRQDWLHVLPRVKREVHNRAYLPSSEFNDVKFDLLQEEKDFIYDVSFSFLNNNYQSFLL